eukprot:UN4249
MLERHRHLCRTDNGIALRIGNRVALHIDSHIVPRIGNYVVLPLKDRIVLCLHAALRRCPDRLCLGGVPRRPLGFSWRLADVQDALFGVVCEGKSLPEQPLLPFALEPVESDTIAALVAQPAAAVEDAPRESVVGPLMREQVPQQLVPFSLLQSMTSQHLRHSLAGKVRHALAGWQWRALGGTVHDVDHLSDSQGP